MQDHSPGPWHPYPSPTLNRMYAVNDKDGTVVAYIASRPGERGNMHLVAAAEDLLAALQAIGVYPWGYCYCPPHMGDMEGKPEEEHCGECRDARAAIRKARGET